MVKQIINVNLYPKSGYVFKDQQGVTHQADSWGNLIRKVMAYRKRKGQPTNNTVAEVTAQACANNPAFCRSVSDERRNEYRKVSLKGLVLKFLAEARRLKDAGKLVFVHPQDALHRADVCARCPFNQALPGGCGSCKKARREGQLYVLGRQRAVDGRCNGCMVLGEDTAVSAHLEQLAVDNRELPANCWRKKTI